MTPSPEQQAVIDHPLEPLRVTAGAGTGKTTTMAWRLASLVRNSGLAQEEALGITFTNKAAQELADRLRSELADHAAHGRQVEVATYHGFAHSILAEFGALVGAERGAKVLTPGYTRQLLRDALGDGSYRILDLSAAGRRVEDLSKLAGQLGDNLVDPADLLAGGTGDIEAERAELAEALVRYNEAKKRIGGVDYADLIRLAHRLVNDHPDVAERIRARYRVLLLDEYQDTNAAQRELLLTIFGEGFPVTAVGDADQTIYEWRGASRQNFAAFPRHFGHPDGSEAPTRQLTLNRRSDRHIIDVANLVRTHLDTTEGVDELRPLPDAGTGFVGHGWLRTAADEAAWIAAIARRLHDEEGMAWSDMAVLFRKNAQMAQVRLALEEAEIPVEVAALGGLLDVPEVSDLHAWLRLVGKSDDAASLVRILLGSSYRLGLADLAPLAAWVAENRRADQGDEREEVPGWAMLEAADRYTEIEDLSEEAGRRLSHFRGVYRELLREAQGVTLVELCRRILDRTGVWPEVEALDPPARLSARLNLYRFLDLAEEWSPIEGRPSLTAFLDYLDLLLQEQASEELDTARLSDQNAVALLTVHRAKGLEWPVVFLPALCRRTFPAKSLGFDNPLTQARSLPYELRLDSEIYPVLTGDRSKDTGLLRADHEAQEWRTAYVAVTRAMHRIYASGAFWYTGSTPKEPSELFDLIVGVAASEQLARTDDPGEPPGPALRRGPAPDPDFAEGWLAALQASIADPSWPEERAGRDGRLEPYHAQMEQLRITLDGLPEPSPEDEAPGAFQTSVTGLVTYATCPKRFMWSEVDPLPRRPSAAARRGIELHRRIELHNRGTVPLDEDIEDLYDVGPGEEAETPAADAFAAFKASRFGAIRPLFVEVPFDLRLGEARVRGRIDAVYEIDGGWEIVDFKSGRPSHDPARRVQLEAYALAATDVPFAAAPPAALKVTFAYLWEGLTEVSEDVDEAWLGSARSHLQELVSGASGDEYPATASPACRNCDFLRFCDAGQSWAEEHAED